MSDNGGFAASHVLIGKGNSQQMTYHHLEKALTETDTSLRLFGKPSVQGERRLGVALALGTTLAQAREKARQIANNIEIQFD